MASSRHAYTALTPNFADFPPLSPGGEQQSRYTVLLPELGDGQSRWQARLGKCKALVRSNTGLLLVTAAQAFLSLVNVSVKKLHGIDPPVSTLELVVVRMGITYGCCVAFMLIQNVPDPFLGPKEVRLLLLFRGFSGFFGLFGVYYSLKYLSLSDATVITFLAPLCTAVTGALVLKEKFTLREALAGIFSLLGVVLIARPAFLFGALKNLQNSSPDDSGSPAVDTPENGTPHDRLVAVGAGLVSVVGSAGAYTSIRAIGKRAHPLHSLSYFSLHSVIASSVGMLITQTPFIIPTRLLWLGLLAIIGFFGFIAQVLLTMGLQRETASRGTMAVYTQVVFATILERIFFHSFPSPLSVVGTIIIISSALYIALTKEKEVEVDNAVSLERLDHPSLEEGLLDRSSMSDSGKPRGIQPKVESEEAQILQFDVDSDHDIDSDKEEEVGT